MRSLHNEIHRVRQETIQEYRQRSQFPACRAAQAGRQPVTARPRTHARNVAQHAVILALERIRPSV